MKKLLGIAIALAVCLAVAPGAFAIDDGSLEKMTTEGLYDRNDAFDHALEPGLLYHLDRWRLYTNLSGYDSDSPSGDRYCCLEDYGWDSCNYENEGSYLIGTSGPLFTGNVAFFYETNRYKFEGTEYSWSLNASESPNPTPPYPRYDGVNDTEYTYMYNSGRPYEFFREAACPTCTDVPSAEGEIEENNFYAAYGMDFDGFSLGLSYAPELRDEEVSMRAHRNGHRDHFDGSNFYPNMPGSTFFGRIDRGYWADIRDPESEADTGWWRTGSGATDYEYGDYQHENSGKLTRDITVHPVQLQSHIRLWTDWDILVGVGYAGIEEQDEFRAVRTENGSSYDTEYGLRNYYTGTVTVDGAVCEDRDGDKWSIYVSPQRVINDLVSVRLDLYYASEDGDLKGGERTAADYTEVDLGAIPGESDVETLHFQSFEDNSFSGDYEIDTWAIEPRVYLTFDRVRFGLGAGYRYEDEEMDGTQRMDFSALFTVDNSIDGFLTGPADLKYWGSWTGYWRRDSEIETTTWRFPVATEFMVTDKLTFRAGAAYYRQKIDAEQTGHEGYRENEYWAVTDGEGNTAPGGVPVVSNPTGPEDQVVAAGTADIPYDADTQEWEGKESFELTTDWTTYNLGVGYQFTENLQMDLMWAGKGESGGVDMTEVFASVTLAF